MRCAFGRGFWPEGPGGANELCHRLAAIPVLHDELISKVSNASTLAAEERIRANDKMRTLAAYASLLVPISPDDAKSVFGMAAKVASELDIEAMHQIRLLERLIENGASAFEADERAQARMAAEFVGDAAIRLGDQDHFPVGGGHDMHRSIGRSGRTCKRCALGRFRCRERQYDAFTPLLKSDCGKSTSMAYTRRG